MTGAWFLHVFRRRTGAGTCVRNSQAPARKPLVPYRTWLLIDADVDLVVYMVDMTTWVRQRE